jgi:Negative regulator of sigma F
LSDLSFLNQIPDPLPSKTGEAEARPAAGSGRAAGARAPKAASPTRSATRQRRAAALALSVAWLCAHLAVYGVRQDFAQLPTGYIAAQVVLPMLFGICCLIAALAPGKLGLGLGVGLVGAMALLGPLSFWLLATGVPMPHPPAAGGMGFWLGSLLCMDITLSWAAAPLLLVALSLRRAFAGAAAPRSALVGAALGLLSGGAINLHCSNVDRWHMLAGHGIPVLVAASLGALLVVRWTRA